MGGKSGASEQNDGKWPQSGEQQPVSHRADASVRVGEVEEVKADRVDEVGPAREVLVQADAVDGAERRGDLVEADQDLELGLEANLSQDTVVWFDCGCVCVCKGACEPATRR